MKGKSERIWKAPFACGIGFGSSRVRVQLILRFRLPIYEREYSKDGFSTFVLFPTSYMRKLYMEKNDDDDDRAMKLCPILFGESLWHERCCAFFFPTNPPLLVLLQLSYAMILFDWPSLTVTRFATSCSTPIASSSFFFPFLFPCDNIRGTSVTSFPRLWHVVVSTCISRRQKKKTFVDGSSRPSIASIRDAAAPKVSIGRALR